jgi:hypothetical protein
MDSEHAQLQSETEQVIRIVSELTGLTSRWGGAVRLVNGSGFLARKSWSCEIDVDRNIANRDERWPTIVHEAMHSVSVGLTREAYVRLRGWEEGLAENLQRLLLPQIAKALTLELDSATLDKRSANHIFYPSPGRWRIFELPLQRPEMPQTQLVSMFI